MIFRTALLIAAAGCEGRSFTIDRPKLRWFPCEQPMVLDSSIRWTGAPMDFRAYHLADERAGQTVTYANSFFKEITFAKEKETYWFGRKEKVSEIVQCDLRYNCSLTTNYSLFRHVATTSSHSHTFEEWRAIANPRPPHPEALAGVAYMSPHNAIPVKVRAPRYAWFNPITWGVKGTYTVKYKFGFELYSSSEEVEVYFPLKLPSGQLSGLYGLGTAYYDWDEWHLD